MTISHTNVLAAMDQYKLRRKPNLLVSKIYKYMQEENKTF